VFPVVSVREIYSAISQIHSFKFGLNHWILSKYDYGLKKNIQDAIGSSMHNIMAMEKSAKRLTVNGEPDNLNSN